MMEAYEKKIYSCYCLFDVCCLSESKDEDLPQLSKRIETFMRKKYERLLEEGLCSCCHCKPLKFRTKGIWILKETNHEFEYVCKYVVCREYISNRLKHVFIGEYEELKMNSHCERKKIFLESVGNYPCCYNYYRTGLLNSAFFCTNCKVFLSSLADFRLKKVCLIK